MQTTKYNLITKMSAETGVHRTQKKNLLMTMKHDKYATDDIVGTGSTNDCNKAEVVEWTKRLQDGVIVEEGTAKVKDELQKHVSEKLIVDCQQSLGSDESVKTAHVIVEIQ
ncbi:hypothetical protein NDU88_000244 [Pleurodeles waltl]|uniref:Uncharacterized protein n=1 Tax=Pleurodeles waltl TaxID=8319 RepID=A0AAV7VWT6_PLEWA|nr:hypothetical protein NDU88_000244 [Pleurodeles waltl]